MNSELNIEIFLISRPCDIATFQRVTLLNPSISFHAVHCLEHFSRYFETRLKIQFYLPGIVICSRFSTENYFESGFLSQSKLQEKDSRYVTIPELYVEKRKTVQNCNCAHHTVSLNRIWLIDEMNPGNDYYPSPDLYLGNQKAQKIEKFHQPFWRFLRFFLELRQNYSFWGR